MNTIKKCLDLVFNFKGFANRKQFLLGTFLSILIGMPFLFMAFGMTIGCGLAGCSTVWLFCVFLFLLLGALSLSAIIIKRIRTVFGSGYWSILVLLIYYFLWQLVGTVTHNISMLPCLFILHTVILFILDNKNS